MKPESFMGPGGIKGIVSKYHVDGVPSYAVRLFNGKVNFTVGDGDKNEVTSYQELPLNQWTHVAATYNVDDGVISIFINGVQDIMKSGATLATNTSGLRIGVDFNNRFFEGGIDDVRIWSGARTAAQILQLKNNDLGGTEAGLMNYWKLDTATGGVTPDLAGFNNVGIVEGTQILIENSR